MSLKGRSHWAVNVGIDDAEKLSLESIGRFVEASEGIQFEAADRPRSLRLGALVLTTLPRRP